MEKNPRIRKDGLPYGSPRVRMSKAAELKIHNGESLKDEPVITDQQSDAPNDPAPKDETAVTESTTTFDPPAIVNKEETGKLVIMNEPKEMRKVTMSVTIDQIGLRFKKTGELIDPYNNILKKIEVTMEGEVIDIPQVAGRVANDLYDFYQSLVGSSIKRGEGFNVGLSIEDHTVTEKSSVKFKSISRLRMSNPINVAYAIGSAILTQVEESNADNLMTGSFKVSKDGELLMRKLKFSENSFNLPLHVIKQQMNEKRLTINKNIKENKAKATK